MRPKMGVEPIFPSLHPTQQTHEGRVLSTESEALSQFCGERRVHFARCSVLGTPGSSAQLSRQLYPRYLTGAALRVLNDEFIKKFCEKISTRGKVLC
jgi:hypothetical protein